MKLDIKYNKPGVQVASRVAEQLSRQFLELGGLSYPHKKKDLRS